MNDDHVWQFVTGGMQRAGGEASFGCPIGGDGGQVDSSESSQPIFVMPLSCDPPQCEQRRPSRCTGGEVTDPCRPLASKGEEESK